MPSPELANTFFRVAPHAGVERNNTLLGTGSPKRTVPIQM